MATVIASEKFAGIAVFIAANRDLAVRAAELRLPAGPHEARGHRLYHALDRRFAELRKRFDDFWVFNCTPDPRNCGLKSLPFYPYEKAVEYARAECSKPMDTAGWYDSSSKVKSESDGI